MTRGRARRTGRAQARLGSSTLWDAPLTPQTAQQALSPELGNSSFADVQEVRATGPFAAHPSNLAKALRGLILAHGRRPCPAFSISGSRTRPCGGPSVAGFTVKTQPHLEGLSAHTGTRSSMASAAHQVTWQTGKSGPCL